MIKNITHDEDGSIKEKTPIVGKVVAGEAPTDDRPYPIAFDHFKIQRKKKFNNDTEWVPDEEIMEAIDPDSHEPEEITIAFIYDDPEMNLKTSLQWWKGRGGDNGHLHCYGDGETAYRWDDAREERKEISCPCDKLEEGICKPNGQLRFIILDGPTKIGGLYTFYTTSERTIRQLLTTMKEVKNMTKPEGSDWEKGRLRGIPLKLKLHPDRTQYRDGDGNTQSTVHNFAFLEFDVNDNHKNVLDRLDELGLRGEAEPEDNNDFGDIEKVDEEEDIVSAEQVLQDD